MTKGRKTAMEPFVFISYSTKEAKAANALLGYLESNGVKCWIAPRDIGVGKDYSEEIPSAIAACSAMVVLVSKAAEASEYVKNEIVTALDHHKTIFPVKMHGGALTVAMKFQLARAQWVDAMDGIESAFPPLLHAIRGLAAGPVLAESEGAEKSNPNAFPAAPASDNESADSSPYSAEVYFPERAACSSRATYREAALIIGVGGTGTAVIRRFEKTLKDTAYRDNGNVNIVSLVFDKGLGDIAGDAHIAGVSLGLRNSWKHVREMVGDDVWSDVFASASDLYLDNSEINTRREAYMAFLNAMGFWEQRRAVTRILEDLRLEGDAKICVYVVASTAGNVGSGVSVPIALYVKKLIKSMYGESVHVETNAVVTLPNVHETGALIGETICSKRANAYAFFRELSAIQEAAYGRAGETNIRIGHRESEVGVLFDTQDPMFWTPVMMPFDYVHVLGRKTENASVSSHYEMLANALYTLVCTDVAGDALSLLSKRAAVWVPEKGLPFFTALGCVEIEHPVCEMLDYFAWRATEDMLGAGWFFLHERVEEEIAARVEHAKEQRKCYLVSTEAYARMFSDAYRRESSGFAARPMMEKIRDDLCVTREEDGRLACINTFASYWTELIYRLERTIPDEAAYIDALPDLNNVKKPSLFASRAERAETAAAVYRAAEDAARQIHAYYTDTLKCMRSAKTFVHEILPMTEDALAHDGAFSFVAGVLQKDGVPIHPVSAFLQLCELRLQIVEELKKNAAHGWGAVFSAEDVERIPSDFLECMTNQYEIVASAGEKLLKKANKSAYFSRGSTRFATLLTKEGKEWYQGVKTNCAADLDTILFDAHNLLHRLAVRARSGFVALVLQELLTSLDALIESYRRVFSTMAEAKQSVSREVMIAEKNKAVARGSACYYVGASRDERRRRYESMLEEVPLFYLTGHSAVGTEVFRTACGQVMRGSEGVSVSDVMPIFAFMQRECREMFSISDFGILLRRKSVFDAIKDETDGRDTAEALLRYMRTADATAEPAISPKKRGMRELRFMVVPTAFAHSLRDDPQRFGVRMSENLPGAVDSLYEVADTWFPDGVIVRVEDIPENTVQILRLSAPFGAGELDAVSENTPDGCYAEYLRVIEMANKYGSEDLIPHLGRGWHLAGRLPYVVRTFEP